MLGVGTELQGKRQKKLTQILILCLWKNALFWLFEIFLCPLGPFAPTPLHPGTYCTFLNWGFLFLDVHHARTHILPQVFMGPSVVARLLCTILLAVLSLVVCYRWVPRVIQPRCRRHGNLDWHGNTSWFSITQDGSNFNVWISQNWLIFLRDHLLQDCYEQYCLLYYKSHVIGGSH